MQTSMLCVQLNLIPPLNPPLACMITCFFPLLSAFSQACCTAPRLQLHCMQLKQKNKHLQDEQERLLEQNIDLQERQQQLLLQQLQQAEQEKAQRLLQQQEQLKVCQEHTQMEKELAAREATLAECHQQLQEAKAVLQVRLMLAAISHA